MLDEHKNDFVLEPWQQQAEEREKETSGKKRGRGHRAPENLETVQKKGLFGWGTWIL